MENTSIRSVEDLEAQITFESLLKRRIYDDVHGFVYLTVDEKKLLSNPYMRRLHFIKQNALANFVFPGATHTRFSHSVGVLCIVEKMIQKLKTLPKYKIDINPFDHQVIRLAALLHDVGHYPLSHTIEDCFKKYDRYFLNTTNNVNTGSGAVDSSENENFFKNIRNPRKLLEDLPAEAYRDSDFHHERIAKNLIARENSPFSKVVSEILSETHKKIYKRPINSEDLQAYLELIGQIICGDLDYENNKILSKKKEIQEKYFILSLLINSDLDADQMDYMLRDTKNTGIQTTIRVDFLIDNMDICYVDSIKGYYQPVLCFNYKAIESVQQFILSKAYWYTEIIYYDKVVILNRIAKRLYMYCLNKEGKIRSIKDFYEKILYNENEYIKFTDNEFWNKIHQLDREEKNPAIRMLVDVLLGRKKLPKSLNNAELETISISKYGKCLKTCLKGLEISHDEKKQRYDFINKKLNDDTKFPIYVSNKIFKHKGGETEKYPFINRSIFILTSPCNKDECNQGCINTYKLWDVDEIGDNIIHKLLDINTYSMNNPNVQVYVEKCIVYQFNLH